MGHLGGCATSDEIVQAVMNGLSQVGKKLANEGHHPNSVWTGRILFSLGRLGMEFGYAVYPNFDDENERIDRAWLYDLVWCKENFKENRKFEGISLVLESEWKRNIEELNYDFQKLVQAKADIKVFICDWLEDGWKDILMQTVRAFRPQNESERYLIAECQYSSSKCVKGVFKFALIDGCGNLIRF